MRENVAFERASAEQTGTLWRGEKKYRQSVIKYPGLIFFFFFIHLREIVTVFPEHVSASGRDVRGENEKRRFTFLFYGINFIRNTRGPINATEKNGAYKLVLHLNIKLEIFFYSRSAGCFVGSFFMLLLLNRRTRNGAHDETIVKTFQNDKR